METEIFIPSDNPVRLLSAIMEEMDYSKLVYRGQLHLQRPKYFQQQRDQMEEKINTDEGIMLRVNRSIQAEGVFAFIKEDMDFRRFMLRGTVHVAAEWMLLSFAYNFWKLHHKIQNGRLGDHLKDPKAA